VPGTGPTTCKEALDTRGVNDQAKGILMDRHKLTADQAFQALAQMSMKTNRKVHAVADDLVHTGDLPPGNWIAAAP
jgi:AmiR/NasT family two-component response regulator